MVRGRRGLGADKRFWMPKCLTFDITTGQTRFRASQKDSCEQNPLRGTLGAVDSTLPRMWWDFSNGPIGKLEKMLVSMVAICAGTQLGVTVSARREETSYRASRFWTMDDAC